MRIHLVAGILAGSFAAVAPLGTAARGLIALCVALVVAAEAGNSALEAVVDLHGGPPSELGRIAKDAAAGAVLVLAVASVVLFALVTDGCWPSLWRMWRSVLPPGAAGLGLAVAAALLVGRRAPGPRGTALLGAAGGLLSALLAATASCTACASIPLLLFGVALAAARGAQAARGQ
jgi:diacylglycerol kinase (ATP)